MPKRGDENLQKFGRKRLAEVQGYVRSKGQKLIAHTEGPLKGFNEDRFVKEMAARAYDAPFKGHEINSLDDIAVRMELAMGQASIQTPNPGEKIREPDAVIDA